MASASLGLEPLVLGSCCDHEPLEVKQQQPMLLIEAVLEL